MVASRPLQRPCTLRVSSLAFKSSLACAACTSSSTDGFLHHWLLECHAKQPCPHHTWPPFSVGGWNSLDLVSTELFPTSHRSSGLGLLGAAGRLASLTTTLIAGQLMEVRAVGRALPEAFLPPPTQRHPWRV